MSVVVRLIPVAAGLVMVAGCSSSPNGGPEQPPGNAPPMRLVAYNSCDQLLTELRKATAERVGPYGLGGGYASGDLLRNGVPGNGDAQAMAPEAGGPAGASKQNSGPAFSGTNVHEAGADEPDMVKTDGRRIVVLAQGTLQVIDPATRKRTHELKLPSAFGGASHLLLSGDRALVFSGSSPRGPIVEDRAIGDPIGPSAAEMTMLLVDLSGAPKIVGSMKSPAAYVDARQTGSVARIVVRSSPRIEFPDNRGPAFTERRAIQENRKIVQSAPLEAWLPRFSVYEGEGTSGGRDYAVPCERVSSPPGAPGASMLSVLTVDLSKGLGDPAPVSVSADGQTVYGTGTSLYVTGTKWQEPRPWSRRRPSAEDNRTDIHRFDTSGTGVPRYVASGSVSGDLLNQYSMSEHNGLLRVATTTTPPWESGLTRQRSQSSVHVLRQRGARLDNVGRVDGLGKGERIFSVRFIGTTGYVVTFRRTDPLYVIDLKDPGKPVVTGELKINGYSAYLHPLADGRLLGVGQDATSEGQVLGTQVSLFDVSAKPKRISSFRIRGASSESEFDPHAFLYWAKSGLTVIPVNDERSYNSVSDALVLSVGGGQIREQGSVQHKTTVGSGIQRSLVVGDTLWTVSDNGAQANDIGTLGSQAWVSF